MSAYESLNRRKRATGMRAAARECELAGFAGLAEVNNTMADLLDPPPRDRGRGSYERGAQ